MLRKLFYLVSVLMVVGLIGPVAAQDVDMEIGFATPVIDGEVDDIWADASTQNFVPLDDPADGSGTWKVLYDADNLYVIVDVTDDSLQNDSAGSWQDDSVEIYFDGGNTKVNTPLSGDDHQYTFGWTTDEIQGTNITGATEGIEQVQVTTDTGWRIEIKMPWMSIWGVVPQAGDLIGIDVYYNDDDDGGDSREGKMLSFSAIEGWNDASQWGTAMLTVTEGTTFLFDDFESYADDAGLTAAGWTILDTPEAIEGSTWTITNPAGRTNPATLDGSASTGKFLISDSDQQSESNPVDSGASHDVSTPSFSTLGYTTVWLHADVSAQLNNNGAAIFDVEVSTDGGGTWTNVFSRVSPGRASSEGATTRLPDNTNTDGYYGRLDVDLSAVAPNEPDVQVRFRHFEPNWDWWIALDNILINDVAAPQGGPITVFSEDFSNGLGQMNVVSGNGNTGTETWHTSDKGGRYMPGTVQEQGVNRLGPHPNEHPEFAIIDSDADPDPAEDEWLMTPVLDLTGLAEVFLHYDSETVMSSGVSNQEVRVSLDGASTFEAAPIFAYTGGGLFDNGEEPVFAERIFDVSSIAAGESQVVFAFRYTGDGDDWWWAIDNVKVSGTLPEPSDVENLVLNPSFEEDEAILDDPAWQQWATWNPAEGAGSNATVVDTESFDGARSLLIEPVGIENWHFMVLYMPIPVDVGASYTASFWAKAAEPRPLGVQFKATDNTLSWGYTDFQLTTEWAEYSLTADALNGEAKLEFMCAGVEVSLSLDSVSVYKVADAPAEPPVTNLALNPSFEEDEVVLDDPAWTAWCTWNPAEGAGSNATIVDTESADGARSLRVEPVGNENGHFIVANISFPLEFGAGYTFTFWAKAEATRPLTASFKAADNSVSWGFTDFELTTEWAEYSLTSTAESNAGKLEFLCAAVEVPFWLDSVSVYKAE